MQPKELCAVPDVEICASSETLYKLPPVTSSQVEHFNLVSVKLSIKESNNKSTKALMLKCNKHQKDFLEKLNDQMNCVLVVVTNGFLSVIWGARLADKDGKLRVTEITCLKTCKTIYKWKKDQK